MNDLYVNVEQLRELDFTGEGMKKIKQEAAEYYNLDYYKEKITQYMASINTTKLTYEDIIAELVKLFYLDGYMEAISELTDRYSEIITAAENRKLA